MERNADETEIKKAYWNLARKHHPDVNQGDPDAESRFKEINEAYQVLSDPDKRARYDRYGREDVQGGGGWSADFGGFDTFGSIFEAFFGDAARSGPSPDGPSRGHDLKYTMSITLEEAASGVRRPVSFTRMGSCSECGGTGAQAGTSRVTCSQCGGRGQVQSVSNTPFGMFTRVTTCPRCHGEGTIVEKPCQSCSGLGRVDERAELEVEIPAGVDTGARLRIRGEGDSGFRGGPPGDLHVDVIVSPHDVFTRNGNDLHKQAEISFSQAALGDEISFSAIDGSSVSLKIPAGTQSGSELRVRGKGMPSVRGFGGRGDIVVHVTVVTPKSLNRRERELFEELAELEGSRRNVKSKKGRKGIFDNRKRA